MIIKKFSTIITTMLNNKTVLLESFYKSIESVQPQHLIRKQVSLQVNDNKSYLKVCGRTYKLQKPSYMVGFGKAVAGMALELENILGANFKTGIVTIPQGFFQYNPQMHPNSKIKFIEGGDNNLPDQQSLNGSIEIKNLVQQLTIDDLLFVLISGGGSALLTLPKPPITLDEKQNLIKQLQKNGIQINDLNKIRKFLSILKGGGLAECAYPTTTISLILSDIVGDPLDLIASGPTVPNRNHSSEIKEILMKYSNFAQLSDSIKFVLNDSDNSNNRGQKLELFDDNGSYKHVGNFIIGNNRIATEAADTHLISKGYQSTILSTTITGNVTRIAQIYAEIAYNLCNNNKTNLEAYLRSLQQQQDTANNNLNFTIGDQTIKKIINFDLNQPICLISGGETTVVINGNGKGGRNQQLALEFSVELYKKFQNNSNNNKYDVQFLSGGTDGIDGPTDAAGAITSLDLINNYYDKRLEDSNLIIEDYINNNDTYNFLTKYKNGENLIKIGHTGTNVMDIHMLMVTPR